MKLQHPLDYMIDWIREMLPEERDHGDPYDHGWNDCLEAFDENIDEFVEHYATWNSENKKG
jgi:hypothetical protein